jgi:serine/threonine protein kinase/WD40 repeat protein
VEEFLRNLRKSNLLAPEQWKLARAMAARGTRGTAQGAARRAAVPPPEGGTPTASPLTPAELAQSLVERGFITPWQAEMLLKGKKAFFLGNYKLLDCIGSGATAGVFKALQGELCRIVAIKLLTAGLMGNRGAVARFRQEMQAVAALDDPHIVTAYDAGRTKGVYYLVMEFIEGRDLGYLIREHGRLPIGLACEFIRQAAKGLQHAHEKGLVHRDIKPTNLLVTRDAESGRPLVKILDLGLARFVSETCAAEAAASGVLSADGSLTQIGQFLGTPDYISPEQARDTRSADIRSDIFSLGCTLLRLLTGELPFLGETVVEKLEAREKHAAVRAKAIRSDVPLELDAIVARMLARDPDDRYQTPSEVAQALAPFATRTWDSSLLDLERKDRESKPARPPGDDTRLEEFFRSLATQSEDRSLSVAGVARRIQRVRWPVWLAGGAAAALCVLIGFLSWTGAPTASLIIDWPLDQRSGAALSVDGRSVALPPQRKITVAGAAGDRRIELRREGFEPIDATVTLERGKKVEFVPKWRTPADTLRSAAFKSLDACIASAARPDAPGPEVESARSQLLAFLLRYPAAGESTKAVELGMRLRWPLDQLSPIEIEKVNGLCWLSCGDPQSPFEPVGVFGNGELAFWGPVTAAAVSSDGQYVAGASSDGTVQVFGMDDGSLVRGFETAEAPTGIVFSPVEPVLAVADAAGSLSLWNVESGMLQATIPNSFSPLAFSPDGGQLAVRATRQEIALYDTANGELRRTMLGHSTGRLLGLAFSHNGKMLASYASDQSVVLWDVASGQERRRFPQTERPMFSPDDSQLAAGATSGDLLLWDTQTGETKRTLDEAGYPLAFSRDGLTLISKRMGRAVLWNLARGEEQRTVVEVPERAAVSANGRWLAGAEDAFGEMRLWNLADASPPRSIATVFPVESLAFAPDSSRIAAGTRGHVLQIFSLASAHKVPQPALPVTQADLSPDGRALAVRQGSRVLLLDVTTGERVLSLADDVSDLDDLRFSPDGRVIAGYGGWGFFKTSLRLWDASSGRELSLVGDPPGTVRTMSFSADSQFLATAGDSRMVTIWDVARRSISRTLDDFSDRVTTVAFHPDGRRLAVACQDQTVVLRNLETGKTKAMAPAGGACRQLIFSPDGRTLAGSLDNRIVIWSAGRGRIAAELAAEAGVASIAFHPSGTSLISAGKTGTILRWDNPLRERHREEPDWAIRIGPPRGVVRRVFWARDGRHILSVNGNGTLYVLRMTNDEIRTTKE